MNDKEYLWRCMNPKCLDELGVSHDFVSAEPVCPNCGISGKDEDKRIASHIVKLVVIHYEPPSQVSGVGTGEIACQPGKKASPTIRRSGSAKATNCPNCKETESWKKQNSMELVGAEYELVPGG